MRILVVGAGATGGFFGGRLAEAGRDVTFLVRPGRAAVLRERGLRIVGRGEPSVIRPRLVLADQLADPYDLILLGVKATGLRGALEDLAPAVGPDTRIVPMLNGMRHIDDLVECFGDTSVLGGVAMVQATVDEHGDIQRLGDLRSLFYGNLNGQPDARLEDVHTALGGAGFNTDISPDILGDMWAKWVFIASVGAVTCLMRGTVGDVASTPGGVEFAEAVVAECASVATAAGHPVPEANLRTTLATVTDVDSVHASSTYRDLVAGNPVEVEQIFGDLVRRADELDVPVPVIRLTTLHLRVHQQRISAGGPAGRGAA
ncbi:ketopantoate reductase family protein [Pseudonocardia eucalypti]|uniref:2-dehydropantoate 2-reductase n=1 Tax=Pseudonocardia eucalypti TaxID=648755 RepID=A0ABP9R9W8_9PSEU|nr:2-dehydropantoate 2-reductase [Pseudonocardia eucalypti]